MGDNNRHVGALEFTEGIAYHRGVGNDPAASERIRKKFVKEWPRSSPDAVRGAAAAFVERAREPVGS